MQLLPAAEIETRGEPDRAVIWLHGLGADGNDFSPIVPELRLGVELGVRFIFPHAPSIPVTVNGGFVMPAWYDIYDMTIDRRVDTEGLLASAKMVNDLIEREIERGIASENILLAGFSQGGAVAYQTALSSNRPLAGLLAMSTYFATATSIELADANRNLEIMIHHGLYDQIVPEELGQRASQTLLEMGYKAQYLTYPMEHAVCPEQIAAIGDWFKKILQ